MDGFGDSWSARLPQRSGSGVGASARRELSGSYARVAEARHGAKEVTPPPSSPAAALPLGGPRPGT